MGFLSFLDKPFRTGRSKANREAKAAGQRADAQAQLAQQYGQQVIDASIPAFQAGQAGLSELSGLSTPEGLAGLLEGIRTSGLATGIMEDRQSAADAYLAAKGLRRSGAGVKAAADIPNSVLMGLMDSILQRKAQTTGLQLSQAGNVFGGIGALTTDATATARAMQGAAAQKAGILGSLFEAGKDIAAAAVGKPPAPGVK